MTIMYYAEKIFAMFQVRWLLKISYYLIWFDLALGAFRYLKTKKFNSSFGKEGIIRKSEETFFIAGLVILDIILKINFVGFMPTFVPQEIMAYIPVTHVGASDIVCVIVSIYEFVSILKNCCLAGLPLKRLWAEVYIFLRKYTDELPDTDGLQEYLNDYMKIKESQLDKEKHKVGVS